MKKLDINIVYNEIIVRLKASNNVDLITGLENSAAGAATGSEALTQQGSYLLNLRRTDPSAFGLIEQQILEYLNYCKQNGLIIR